MVNDARPEEPQGRGPEQESSGRAEREPPRGPERDPAPAPDLQQQAESFGDAVTFGAMTTDLHRSGEAFLGEVERDAARAAGEPRRNLDQGYRAAAVAAEWQELPDLADQAVNRISDSDVQTEALGDVAAQAALKQDPDRVVEMIDRIPDDASRDRAWDKVEDVTGTEVLDDVAGTRATDDSSDPHDHG
jgi:hypothetical protein